MHAGTTSSFRPFGVRGWSVQERLARERVEAEKITARLQKEEEEKQRREQEVRDRKTAFEEETNRVTAPADKKTGGGGGGDGATIRALAVAAYPGSTSVAGEIRFDEAASLWVLTDSVEEGKTSGWYSGGDLVNGGRGNRVGLIPCSYVRLFTGIVGLGLIWTSFPAFRSSMRPCSFLPFSLSSSFFRRRRPCYAVLCC